MKFLNVLQFAGALMCLFSLSACAGGASGNAASKQYHVVNNGCDSGVHSFDGSSSDDVNTQYCAALQDENLNRDHSPERVSSVGDYCPTETRQDLFQASCNGTFTSHFSTSSQN